MNGQPHRIIPDADGGWGYDVRVPLDPARYDARTIKRMVKLVNRRGRVRYFDHFENQTDHTAVWSEYRPHTEQIKGVDDLLGFIEEALSMDALYGLYVSFEDRHEAKRFASDLTSLRASPVEPLITPEQQGQRAAIAARHVRSDYPQGPAFNRSEGYRQATGYKWATMVSAAGQSHIEVDEWMRGNIKTRYYAAIWRPGTRERMFNKSYRYWRLTENQWCILIDNCRAEDGLLLIVFFWDVGDYELFDRRYGAGQFLHSRPPKLIDRH